MINPKDLPLFGFELQTSGLLAKSHDLLLQLDDFLFLFVHDAFEGVVRN